MIMGTGYYPDTVLRGGLRLIRRLALSRGWRHRSPLVKKLFFFGPFRRFDMTGKEPEKSWLTKDVQAVQADPVDAVKEAWGTSAASSSFR